MDKTFDSGHTDIMHDVQPDFYGKRIATCSSDKLIKIFKEEEGKMIFLTDLKGHEGPVWQISWAHPKFGSLLSSCSYDGSVIIWKETEHQNWVREYEYKEHKKSVNAVAWAPQELGLVLACGSSDGYISILRYRADSGWDREMFAAHPLGVTSLSWSNSQERIVTGGCDNEVIIWNYLNGTWAEERLSPPHDGWVRDVAWAPNIGLTSNTIASCSQNGEIFIWSQTHNKPWTRCVLHTGEIVWRLSWSIIGNILAVTSGDNHVSLYQESLNEPTWKQISYMNENGEFIF